MPEAKIGVEMVNDNPHIQMAVLVDDNHIIRIIDIVNDSSAIQISDIKNDSPDTLICNTMTVLYVVSCYIFLSATHF